MMAFLVSGNVLADSGSPNFPIQQFVIKGNQLLSEEMLQSLVTSHLGADKTVADIRAAQQAIEKAYQAAGYGTVRALTPEQELTDGIVYIQIVESKIIKVTVTGHQNFSAENIRASLPVLQEGELPDLRRISENVQLANENPAKRVEVLLNGTEDQEALEARVLVKEQKPLRISASLANTGSQSTGRHRLGFALQHANLFDRDHVATFSYTTSPEKPEQVDIYSLSYRLPLYALGDSVDFIYGHSTVNSASSQTVAGPLNFSGSGRVLGLRYNHLFPRQGEFSSRLTLGLDKREYLNSCNIAGLSCGSADEDVTVRPVSVTWIGQWQGRSIRSNAYGTFVHNLAGGKNGDTDDYLLVRDGADAHYKLLRLGYSRAWEFGDGWQSRVALNGQYSFSPLVAGEQFGLAGSTAVRGFNERAISVDTGALANLEIYTPNLAPRLGLSGNQHIQMLAFVDAADGRNRAVASGAQIKHATLASLGIGLRGSLSNRVSLQLDIANVIKTHPAANESTGDWRGHFALNILY